MDRSNVKKTTKAFIKSEIESKKADLFKKIKKMYSQK